MTWRCFEKLAFVMELKIILAIYHSENPDNGLGA